MSTYQDLLQKVTGWAEPLEGKSTEEMGAYFDAIFDDYTKLRDHISNYQYAIPSGLFGKYQVTLGQFNDTFTENKEKAMPKKKFTFARRGKKEKTAAKSPKAEPKEEAKTNEID